MIARVVFILGAATALLFVASPDTAAAGPCGGVQYSTTPSAAEPSPAPNPFEPKKASPACRKAAKAGSIAAAGAGVVAAGAVLVTRFNRGGTTGSVPASAGHSASAPPAGSSPTAPPPGLPPAPPQLHLGNAHHDMFIRMFPGLINRNPFHWTGATEWTMNCQSCCVMAEAVFRGREAIALPRYGVGTVWDKYAGDWRTRIANAVAMPGARWQQIAGYDAIAQHLLAAGNGSRAIVYGAWRDSPKTWASHVFNAVNRNGVVCFVDLQTGTWAYPRAYASFEILRTN